MPTSPDMPITSYSQLEVWQKSVDLVCAVYQFSIQLPSNERFGLSSQLKRSSISIPANIAEGYGRSTRGEYRNQVSVARGSACELEALCFVCERLGIGDTGALAALRKSANDVQRMLARLWTRLGEKKQG